MTQPVATGRDADVYDAGPSRVLRRYRDGRDASSEARLMRWLSQQGYPVPHVYAVRGPDLEMERVDGPTMGTLLLIGEMDAADSGTRLADLHDRLHRLPPFAASAGAVLHLDLHPFNVLVAGAGHLYVIDWANAESGDPALDVAMTAVILAQAAVAAPPETAGAGVDVPAGIRAVVEAFLGAVSHDPGPALDEAASRRRTDRHMSRAEVDAVDDAVALIRRL